MTEGVRIPVPPGADLMGPYPVKLPQFEGPLDLLLHLIRKNEVDIRNIPVAVICRQYHEYLVLMQELDLEVAAEFLYVEALLVHVKSQMVLPRPPDGTPREDPRDELVRRLIEYRKYKGVAETLHEMEAARLGLWSRPPTRLEATEAEAEETDLSEVSLFDLLTFFKGTLERYRAAHPASMEIEHQRFSIKEKMEEMLSRVKAGGGPVPLSDVFRALSGRAEAIAVFLAVLELLRLRVVRARQDAEFGDILLESTGENVTLEGYEEAYR
ncbi:MAG: segregation/condensation protein A [Thermoanaerobaculia bacterium]|jgi:segregation and condensation protein A